MNLIFRALIFLFIVPAVYFFVYWVPFSLIQFSPDSWIPSIVSLICALGVGGYVWKKSGPAAGGLLQYVIFGAFVTGGVGFCAGFFGPLIFTPEANQGPLLGLLITGPLGFLVGGVGGFVYWTVKRKKSGAGQKGIEGG
ncbi:MAG: hypothetical protein L0196_09305 [candidate division Zixibacteria bacterium]|nr:hypothetical protein [candidate division Zixibacteria bacterium]